MNGFRNRAHSEMLVGVPLLACAAAALSVTTRPRATPVVMAIGSNAAAAKEQQRLYFEMA